MAHTHKTNTRRLVHRLDRTSREQSAAGDRSASNQISNEIAAIGGGQYRPRYGNHRKMMADQKVQLRRNERRQRNREPLEND